MYKATVLIIIIIGAILGSITFFILKPQESPVLNSSCASLGVSKLTPRYIQQIKDNPEYKNIMTLSDSDLTQVPKLLPLIQKVSNKMDYNDQVSHIVNGSEMQQYRQFLVYKLKQQQGFELDKEKDLVILEYNKKTYLLGGISIPKDGFADNVTFTVSEKPTILVPKITLDDSDFETIPDIKRAIEEIGTYQVQSYESVGMPEPEFNQYQKWFEERYYSQYGNITGAYSYFQYGDKVYSASFSIC